MKIAPDIREQRKVAHLERIKAKQENPEGYAELYAAQPAEIRKGNEQRGQRRAIADAKRSLQLAMGSDAQGATEVFAGGQVSASVGLSSDVAGSGSV